MRFLTNSVDYKFLSDVLSLESMKDHFLGVGDVKPESSDQMKSDAAKIVQYAKSSGYQAWSREAWSMMLNDLDKLLQADIVESEVNFLRGRIKATLDLLRKPSDKRIMLEDK